MVLRGKALSIAQLALVVGPAFILYGYNQSGLGGLLSLSDWTAHFPEIDTIHTKGAQKAHNATVQGAVVASFVVGAVFGALSCSFLGDRFGRRKTIFAGAVIALIGMILECSAFQLAHLIVGRVILGFGVGMLSGTVPTWQAECSSSKNRGKHVVLDGMFICVGYTLESWIDLGFYEFKTGPVTWRPPIAIAIFFSLVIIGCVFIFPDSPRWLVKQNKIAEARIALARYKDLEEDDPKIILEISAIENSLEETAHSAASLGDLFKMGEDKLFYRFSLCILLQFFQQMCGSNLISVYSTVIFQQGLGLDSFISRVLSGGTLTWKLLSSFVAFFAIDRWGRRSVFMFSGVGMSSCMLGLAVATSFPKSNYAAQIVSALFVFLFNFFVPIGFLGANFLYCAEIAPLRMRMAMASISTANHWLWNFVVTMITPIAIESIGYKYYIVYACIGACIPASVYFLYPETMGRPLEDIDLIFRNSPSVLGTVKYAKHTPVQVRDSEHVEKVDKEEIENV